MLAADADAPQSPLAGLLALALLVVAILGADAVSAMVLGLRARSPFEEWSRIDPVSLGLLRPMPFDRTLRIDENVSIRFYPAGHILGAAFVDVRLRMKDGGEKNKADTEYPAYQPTPWEGRTVIVREMGRDLLVGPRG